MIVASGEIPYLSGFFKEGVTLRQSDDLYARIEWPT